MEVLAGKSTNNSQTTQNNISSPGLLICFSHLRWDFVYQRPQHLLTRFSKNYLTFFVEEPYFDSHGESTLSFSKRGESLWIVAPHLPVNTNEADAISLQKDLLDGLLKEHSLSNMIFWYYTPMAIAFSGHLTPSAVVYDCMDELSNFKNAPLLLKQYEEALLHKADVVFTGGQSLYEAKKDSHKNIHAFPSSIDKDHFEQARTIRVEPADQQNIPHPRLGFYGVIDERFDIDLIAELAEAKPDWHIVLLGPVVKIDPATLPTLPNIHFLGSKKYEELPQYLSGWDVALIPFLLNEATRFISPTKTPEYLAAGVPVVSTPITDVVNPYGDAGIVEIASTAKEFITSATAMLALDKAKFLPVADAFLSKQSWALTFERMNKKINETIFQNKN